MSDMSSIPSGPVVPGSTFRPTPPRGPAPAPAQAPRRRIGILSILIFILLLCSIGANVVLLIMLALVASGDEGSVAHVQAEVLVKGSHDKVAILPIEGVIDGGQAERVYNFCEYIKNDSSIKAVVIAVDSPGGGVTSSDEIHHMLTQLRGTGRKMVVSMGGLAASGGYYVSMPAEKIYAQPTTITGSIGVIMSSFEVTDLMTKIGVKPETVKSDAAEEFKDAGSPFKKWTAEDRDYFKGLINNAHLKFSAIVDEGRKGKLTQPIAKIAIGKVWTVEKAKDLGLIDEIAYLDEVCTKTAHDAGIPDATVVRLRPKSTFLELFGASARGAGKVELKVNAEDFRKLTGGVMEYRYDGIY